MATTQQPRVLDSVSAVSPAVWPVDHLALVCMGLPTSATTPQLEGPTTTSSLPPAEASLPWRVFGARACCPCALSSSRTHLLRDFQNL